MIEMIKPQGEPYKTLRSNPHLSKTHKIGFYNWSSGFIQNETES